MMWWMKFSCLLMYGLALAGWTGVWSGSTAIAIQIVATVILAVHAIEVVIAFKYVRRYQGMLATSVLLTLLFGLLHLVPLARRARQKEQASATSGVTLD